MAAARATPPPPPRDADAPAPAEPSPHALPLRPRVRGRRQVVTAFVLDARGRALVVRRSGRVRDYRGLWGGVSGGVEAGDASLLARALAEVREEAGLAGQRLSLVRCGMPLAVDDDDGGRKFLVHPFLLRWRGREEEAEEEGAEEPTPPVRLNWENDEARWVSSDELRALPHVPLLPETLERVLPSAPELEAALVRLAADRASGAAELAKAALASLASSARACGLDGALPAAATAALDRWRAYAFLLATARPSMAAVANAVAGVVDAVMAAAAEEADPTGTMRRRVVEAAAGTHDAAQERAASAAARAIFRRWSADRQRPGEPRRLVVLTLSRSSLVAGALERLAALVAEDAAAGEAAAEAPDLAPTTTTPPPPLPNPLLRVLESRPLFEGVRMARCLQAATGWDCELFTDAQSAVAARGATCALVGADAVTAAPLLGGGDDDGAGGGGFLVNKAGTLPLTLACRELGVPVFAVTDPLKVSPGPVLRSGVLGRGGEEEEEQEEEMAPEEVTAAWPRGAQEERGVSATPPRVRNVYFEATPLRLITGGVVTGGGGAGGGSEEEEEGGGGTMSSDQVAVEAARWRAQYDRVFGLLG